MRFVCCFAGMIAFTTGCQGLPATRSSCVKPRLADREAVAQALPQGHTLDQVIKADSRSVGLGGKTRFVNPVTLEEKLAEVGASVGPDGKLRDATGKEIYFRRNVRYGCQTYRYDEELNEARQLEDKYRVIYFDSDPGGPLPC